MLGTVVGLIAAALFFGFRALLQLQRNGVRSGAINLVGAFVLFAAAWILAGAVLPAVESLERESSGFLGGCQKGCVAQGNQKAACQPYCECLLSTLSEGKSPEEFNELVANAGQEGPSESREEAASAAETCAANMDELLQPKRQEDTPASDPGGPNGTNG